MIISRMVVHLVHFWLRCAAVCILSLLRPPEIATIGAPSPSAVLLPIIDAMQTWVYWLAIGGSIIMGATSILVQITGLPGLAPDPSTRPAGTPPPPAPTFADKWAQAAAQDPVIGFADHVLTIVDDAMKRPWVKARRRFRRD